jgi:hypothetical protein
MLTHPLERSAAAIVDFRKSGVGEQYDVTSICRDAPLGSTYSEQTKALVAVDQAADIWDVQF